MMSSSFSWIYLELIFGLKPRVCIGENAELEGDELPIRYCGKPATGVGQAPHAASR
jgi:hypothetical protein